MLPTKQNMGKGQDLLDAARKGDVEKLFALISKRSGPFPSLRRGAGVNVQDDKGKTPLHLACLQQHNEIVRLLLSVDASPCIVDKAGATPLHYAAFNGNPDIVAMLLAHTTPPVNVNHQTMNLETPLLMAAPFGHVEVVQKLMAAGADVTLKNVKNETALDLAAQFGRTEVVRLLLRACPKLIDPYRHPNSTKQVFSNTPLHRASINGHKNIVSLLIEAGVDPNVSTGEGTPLHEAVRFYRASVVRVLLHNGADVRARRRDGSTVLDMLAGQAQEASRRVRNVIREFDTSEDEPPCFPVSPTYPVAGTSTGLTKAMPRGVDVLACVTNLNSIKNNKKVTNATVSPLLPPHNCSNGFQSLHHVKNKEKVDKNSCNNQVPRDEIKHVPIESDNFYANDKELDENIIKSLTKSRKNTLVAIKELDGASIMYGNITYLPNSEKLNENLKPRPLPPPKPAAENIVKGEEVLLKPTDVVRQLKRQSTTTSHSFTDVLDAVRKIRDQNNRHVTLQKETEKRKTVKIDTVNNDDIYQNMLTRNMPDDVKIRLSNAPQLYEVMLASKQSERRSLNEEVTCGLHVRGESGCLYSSMDDMYKYIYSFNQQSLYDCSGPIFHKIREKRDPKEPCLCGSRKLEHSSELSFKSVNSIDESGYYVNFDDKCDIYSSLIDVTDSNDHKDYADVTMNDENKKDDEANEVKQLQFIPFVDTPMVTEDDKNPKNLSGEPTLFRKKICQIKQFFGDWKKAPDTQKNINKLDSFLSPSSSSLTKKHPQSFVKKLAQKCLGFKSKFNSAPNICDTSGLESVDALQYKHSDQKISTNTLHIGNSKFFKMLLKKEESGEINCTDEFDTISLDRLGTLNRDSVVNRSNRSCPGFKTSLPDIYENTEISESHDSLADSVIMKSDCISEQTKNTKITEAVNYNTKLSIFEPREINAVDFNSNTNDDCANFVNECYESCEISSKNSCNNNSKHNLSPKPSPRPLLIKSSGKDVLYENVNIKPTPATRTHVPSNNMQNNVEKNVLYENVVLKGELKPHPLKRTVLISQGSSDNTSRTISSSSISSSVSSDSMIDESNLEDILISEKSKSFKHGQKITLFEDIKKSDVCRTQSNASIVSDISDVTQASALENVDCSEDVSEQDVRLSMTGTLPNKKPERLVKKKVLFRHKTFTNIEVDRNSLPKWNGSITKETLANYHIRGTGHCIFKAPTVLEFINMFNKESLYNNTYSTCVGSNTKRDSYFETVICFCKSKPRKHHLSAEDLEVHIEEAKASIDTDALRNRLEIKSTSFSCYCDVGTCRFHSTKRTSPGDLVVKFSAVKRSISTPDITLETSPSSTEIKKNQLTRKQSVPYKLETSCTVSKVNEVMNKNHSENKNEFRISTVSHRSTMSSTSSRPYSIKDIADVISLNSTSSADPNLTCASDKQLPLRKTSSSEYSGQWSLQSCDSNVTIKSDASYKTCFEESSDDGSDGSEGTLQSDGESSDAETVTSDASTSRRPWVSSGSFRFEHKEVKFQNDVIVEEDSSDALGEANSESYAKFESGISVGSESSSSACDTDGCIPRVGSDVSLGIASLERGSGAVAGVRSGSGRRRWEEAEGTSEGDALSVSSAASSCAAHHLGHHLEYSKVSPTPPKKPPRRNLSVSPTHANSPSSGYSYELRTHARSQDDLDDIQGPKLYLKHGRSVDQYVDGKLSYSEYEENHNSPRIIPVPNPRSSLKNRTQPVAITAMYENVVIREQNPRRKLKRNNFGPQHDNCDSRMNDNRVRKYSNQERSSMESLLDSQSLNSPSDCERYYEGHKVDVPSSPTHYEQPPTPDHPPPSAKQAENSIHERIRPLSQEYKRRSVSRDSQTETELCLLRAVSAASVASGATDRSGATDNCVEEYVCDEPFAGLFKGSTTTLDGIGLRPMPAERPKTLRKLKSVYDASPTETPPAHITNVSSNGQPTERNLNGAEDEVRRRSNTTSSTHSGDKSLSILSPFDEQEEWAKISEIMASFGSKLVRESVFVSELEQEFTSRLGLSCSESSLSPSVASTLGLWLSGLGLHDYEPLFLESGYDDIDFVNGILDDNDLREMGIEDNDRHKILESAKQLPLKIAEISNNNNNISNKNQNESVDEWLRIINLEQYSDTFRKHLYVDMDRVRRIWEVELTAVLEIQKAGHRKRILASVSGERNGPANHNMADINADLKTLKSNIQQLKEEIKEKLPLSENLKAVPPPVVPTLAPPGGETLKRSKKNRPAPQPPRPSDLEIRAPSELLVGVPGALRTQWKHQPFVLVTGAVTYVANYLGSTVVKELRGTESTKKSIQKLKKTKEPIDSPDIILSISYRGVKFLNTITRELVCEHEIRNIHCACQDADDLTHFAYITKDHTTKSHYCHVFRVATMDQATEVILTLGEAFEVAYQMVLREQSNRTRVTQSQAKTPTHDPMTTTNKEKPTVNHGRSHSITEIKLNGHQLKIAPIPASLSNEDFQASRNSDGSRSPRTPLLKAPIASTEEL